ncbi:MAG TPA: N-acetylmuramoyl-L-alanine amidase [Vicinamibacterales bacterium]|nr:N-acetylmuramoyl-L-alanine amidase [Vicinamibacterales bacterium]
MKQHSILALALTFGLLAAAPARAADNARDLYERALAQERTVRDASNDATQAAMRRVIAAYERIVAKYPKSGYSDNALWQAANLSMLSYERFGTDADRERARKLFAALISQYPSSSLARRAKAEAAATAHADDPAASSPADEAPDASATGPQHAAAGTTGKEPAAAPSDTVLLKGIHRSLMPDGVRVTIELDAEVPYHEEEVNNPHRVFFDLKGVKAAPSLQDAALKFDDDVVREIRLGRHPQNTTRVVMDLQGVGGYSVYPMYGPYRLVIDFKRTAAANVAGTIPPSLVASLPAPPPATESNPAPLVDTTPPPAPAPKVTARASASHSETKAPLPSTPAATVAVAPPAANSNGKFSLSRQLGLGVSRIVIDAGHGGHDPGAQGNGINESELTLDVAQRLQKLLQKVPDVEVVMTRDSDVFIPLQERTAIANREGADLFLSIHANASRSPAARGIETYFLNFATNPEAEAVAARENAGSGQAMHNLPDIVKAIALNNKINESRDFAETVQKSMVKRLRPRNKTLRDLGVKQAPFVVLIGAGMPSVLAEMSFLTNRQEGVLLKSGAYRQQIAQALFDAIVAYQQALKKQTSATGKKATEF